MNRHAAIDQIEVPPAALVMLIGAAGSGKSAFAARHLPADSVVSSDQLRARIGRDEADQEVNDAVFERLRQTVEDRLASGMLTVIDATNADWVHRGELIRPARRHGRPAIAIVLDLPLEVCLARNAARARTVRPGVVRRQVDAVHNDIDRLELEGFSPVYVLRSTAQVDQVTVQTSAQLPPKRDTKAAP
jgi:protein phosphatase